MAKKKNKTFLEMIKGDFKIIMLENIILTILFLIFGVVIYLHPLYALKTVGIIIGIYFILIGLFNIYEFFMRKLNSLFSIRIFLGVLSIILGIFTIINPFNLFKILTLSLGIYLSIVAIVKIIDSIKLKKYEFDGWFVILVGAILELILGVFIAINPMSSVDIVEATGIFIVLGSILDLAYTIMCYSKAKDIEKAIKNSLSTKA